jgi:protein tyrosine/serine phosphatase
LPQLPPRDLAWDGCLNVRELGGLPTRDGGETRLGAVVRADSVRQLSDDGWQALLEHGIRTVIDLRVVHVPFMEAEEAELRELQDELEAAVEAAPDIETSTRDVYLIFLERFRSNAAAGVRAVADAPAGGVVIHCVGGKDRTGLLSAFLLHLAGVEDDDIAADYALSEERLRPRHEAWFAAAETEEELARLRRIARTPAESMVGVLEEVGARYGGVAEYLRSAGVTDEELRLVRARLRG